MISFFKKLVRMSVDEATGWNDKKRSIQLVPLNDVIKTPQNEWQVTGTDPSFILDGKMRKGWNEFSWHSYAEESIPLKFYIDNGTGFSEERTITPTYIPKGTYEGKIYLFIPYDTKRLRLDTGDRKLIFSLDRLEIQKITRLRMILRASKGQSSSAKDTEPYNHILKKTLMTLKNEGFKSTWSKVKQKVGVNYSIDEYSIWQKNYSFSVPNITQINSEIEFMEYQPLISIVLPVYNVDEVWLRKCIDSVINQYYTKWQLCIADDASTKDHIKRVLDEYQLLDKRIEVIYREKNGHISESSNSALSLVKGDFIGLLDHDDELSKDALYEVAKLLNQDRSLDLIYSDEDFINMDFRRVSPFFKPDWSPDRFLCHMYYGHFGVYRYSLVQQAGGFRKGFEGSQDFDLALRFTEYTQKIAHIPKMLYHWRMIPESTASNASAKSYTHVAGLKALNEAMQRRNIDGWIEELDKYPNYYLIHYNVIEKPLVSILIHVDKDSTEIEELLKHITKNTSYQNYEIILLGNQTSLVNEKLKSKWSNMFTAGFKTIFDASLSTSQLKNLGVLHSSGEHLLFMDCHLRFKHDTWLNDLIGQSQRAETAVIGGYIKNHDQTIAHSGLVIGIGIDHVAEDAYKGHSVEFPGHYGAMFIVRNVSAICSEFFFVGRKIFLDLQGFDENLGESWYNVDFCLKALDDDYVNVWLPYVELESTQKRKIKSLENDTNYMRQKWLTTLRHDRYYNVNYSKDKPYMLNV